MTCTTCGSGHAPAGGVCADCATTQINLASVYPQIPGYRLLNRIGEGGMGQVFLAEDLSLGRRVAIKLMTPQFAQDESAAARFAREARLLATIEHAHVVRVYSFGRVEERPYLVMEFVEGRSLAEEIREKGPLPLEDALRIAREAVEGLQAAHELDIVHRDIKPANILLDRRGRVRVADFGLAKLTSSKGGDDESAITMTGYLVGSPHYISPEQAQGARADLRSDIYALGVVLYEMLSGERPFSGSTPIAVVARHLHEPIPSILAKRPDLHPGVDSLLQRLTAKEPAARPGTYEEVLRELARAGVSDTAAADETFVQLERTMPAPPRERLPSHQVATSRGSLGLAVLLVLIFGAMVWSQRDWLFDDPPPRAAPKADGRLTIAVTPFYGPDAESQREGRVMAALIEREIAMSLGREEVRVVGIEETGTSVRSHDEARELAEKFRAHVVVWGDAFVLRGETDIQPSITLVGMQSAATVAASGERSMDRRSEMVDLMTERTAGIVRLEAQAPNQIEMRKTSAAGVGQMATFLAGIHALHREQNPEKALRLFESAPPSADLLRERAQAQIALDERGKAIALLEEFLALEPDATEARAQLADLLVAEGRLIEAAPLYEMLAAEGEGVTTRNATLTGGKLLVRETYRTARGRGEVAETGNLLVVDPATGIVEKRYPMPGTISEMRWQDGDVVEIGYTFRTPGGERRASATYANGAFKAPLIRGGNLSLRMNSIRSGGQFATNFTSEVAGVLSSQPAVPRFRLSDSPLDGFPKTFDELETALRDAMRQDPTQPWHPFFLGQTFHATGRVREANELWHALYTRDWEGISYADWSKMGAFHLRLGQPAQMRAAVARAEKVRLEEPQPPVVTTLIERLINLSYVRIHPRQQLDDATRHELLQNARRSSGVAEGDHLVAAAWYRHFLAEGDLARAEAEKRWQQRALADPLNFSALAARVDYALYALFASAIAGVAMAWLVLGAALRRFPRVAWMTLVANRWKTALRGRFRTLAIAGVGLAAGGVLVLLALVAGSPDALLILVVLAGLAVVATAPWRRGATWRQTIAAIPRRQRAALLVLLFMAVPSMWFAVSSVLRASALMDLPLGISDSLGHPAIIRSLEEARREHDGREVRYVLAVAHHLAGNVAEAGSLYRSTSDDPRAARAIERLKRNERIVEMPSSSEIAEAYAHPLSAILYVDPDVYDVEAAPALFVVFLAMALAIVALVTFLLIAPVPGAPPPAPGRSRLLLEVVVPGARAVRRGRSWLGAATLTAAALAGSVAIGASGNLEIFGAPGFVTGVSTPNVFASSPFPSAAYADGEGRWVWGRLAMLLAQPHAALFWSLVLLAALFATIVHAIALVAIAREWRVSPKVGAGDADVAPLPA